MPGIQQKLQEKEIKINLRSCTGQLKMGVQVKNGLWLHYSPIQGGSHWGHSEKKPMSRVPNGGLARLFCVAIEVA